MTGRAVTGRVTTGRALIVLLWLAATLLPALAGTAPARAAPLELVAGDAPLSLAGHMELLRGAPGEDRSLAEVLARESAFTPLPGVLGLGFTKDPAWVRVRIHRPDGDRSRWTLELAPPVLDRADVYVATTDAPAGPSDFQHHRVGAEVPVAAWPIPSSTFLLPLDLPPGATRDVYVRVATQTSMMLRGSVYTAPALVDTVSGRTLWYGFVYGAFALAVLFNLVCFAWLRDPSHLLYACYVLSLTLNHLTVTGTLPYLLPGLPAAASKLWLCAGGLLTGCFADLFVIRVLRLRRLMPLAALCLLCTASARPVSLVLTALGDYRSGAVLIQLLGMVSVVTFLAAATRLAWRRDVQAQRFLIAFTPAILGAAVTMLRALGVLPSTVLTEQLYFAGCLFHVVLINISMMTRIRDAELAKQEAQAAALAASHVAEERARRVIEAQTREIRDAKREVEAALAAERAAIRDQLQFIDMIAHEYRTPVSVIRAALDVMDMRPTANGPAPADLVVRMRRSLDRLVEVIEVGLRRDRLDQPGLSIESKPLDVVEIAREAVGEVAQDGPPVRLVGAGAGAGPVRARGDAALLRTAVLNLLDNARKYGPKDQPVDVDVRLEGAFAVVRVIDRGTGVPEHARDRIFEKYYRTTASRAVPGVGLGLYLVRKIATFHGGDLDLETAGAGGSVFRLRLPALVPAGPAVADASAGAPGPTAGD
ncbi:sensor histidine kinase [Azospirillum sp. ST 5-10]|uniref:sensor histidine kinase n=1 Tax=unclassified Azospirillum TaxID=2630922 RepID=UPI003F49F386